MPEPREFTRVQEARDWAHKHWGPAKRYTAEQIEHLREYTDSGHNSVNQFLRNGEVPRYSDSASLSRTVEHIDAAIKTAERVPESIYVWRYATYDMFGGSHRMWCGTYYTRAEGRSVLEKSLGKKFLDKGFMSTSLSSRCPSIYGALQLKIEVPVGARAIYVSGRRGSEGTPSIIAYYGAREAELIFARGSRLEITGFTFPKRSTNIPIVTAKLFQKKG